MEQDEGISSLFPELHVDRPSLTIQGRRNRCAYEPKPKPGFRKKLSQKTKSALSCSREKAYRLLVSKLPIIQWLSEYKIKEYLPLDISAGITVAIVHIPLGMGFALLAYCPAICGIYMAFYQVLIYAFFGTSRQMSMGAFAIITLMTGKVVKEHALIPEEFGGPIMDNSTLNATSLDGIYEPIEVATIVTFMVGIWMLLMGILQLGNLSVFLSDMLVSGFTTAAAFHVLTSQLKYMLGINIPGHSGPLKIIYTYVEIFTALSSANMATLIVTAVCIVILVLNNEVLKPIWAKYTRIPFPIELIVVAIGIAVSYFIKLHDNFEVKIVGHIPTGLPPPTVPPLELCGKVALDSLVIAIVAYTITFSVARIIAKRRDYSVDATQELYAQGITNLGSSFFACCPSAGALARVLIKDAAGAQTQLASFVCCILILMVLLFIGPIFETLPNAVLSSIIVVALKGMFMQVNDMVAMWKISRIDAIVWCVTFFSTVIIDIDYGLLIGVLFSVLILVFRNQKPAFEKLGRLPDTDFYLDVKDYPEAKEVAGMRLLRVVGSIHFANRENLWDNIVTMSEMNPKLLATKKENKIVDYEGQTQSAKEFEKDISLSLDTTGYQGLHYLVIDMSGVSSIDNSGSKFIELVRSEYEKGGVTLCLAGLPDSVLNVMNRSGSLKNFKSYHLFHTLHDAASVLTTPSLFDMIST